MSSGDAPSSGSHENLPSASSGPADPAPAPRSGTVLQRTLLRVKRRRSDALGASQLLSVQAEAAAAEGDAASSRAKRGRFEDVTFALAGTLEGGGGEGGGAAGDGGDIGKVLHRARKSAMERALEEAAKLKKDSSAAAASPRSGDASASRVKIKARRAAKESAAAARYRLLGEHRNLEIRQEGEEAEGAKKETYKIYDVVVEADEKDKKKQPRFIQQPGSGLACNGVEMLREEVEEEADYVYDLYYVDSSSGRKGGSGGGGGPEGEEDSALDICNYIDRLLNVRAFPGDDLDPFSFGSYRAPDGGDDGDDEGGDSDEDSNAEDHWANDYPDEDDEGGACGGGDEDGVGYGEDGEFDLERDMRRFGLEDDSGDEGSGSEDYDEEADGRRLIESMTYQRDEDLHGASYARFKRRVQKEENDEDDDSDDINDIDEFY